MRVLVVDDYPGAADVACVLVELLGHEARAAHSGTQALAEVAAQIRELLTQKILDEQLNNWLHTLRQQGKIQMR